ncbi:MAG: hypothetical protein ACP5DC_10055, partial [Halothiobacillaceae bacterium]
FCFRACESLPSGGRIPQGVPEAGCRNRAVFWRLDANPLLKTCAQTKKHPLNQMDVMVELVAQFMRFMRSNHKILF